METKREFDGRSDVYGMSVLPDIGKRCEGREESNAVSARRRRFLREGLRILGIGTAYFFWVCLTGVGIFADAYSANPFLFVLMPFLVTYGIYRSHLYIKTGSEEYTGVELGLLLLTLVGAIAFAVYRNL